MMLLVCSRRRRSVLLLLLAACCVLSLSNAFVVQPRTAPDLSRPRAPRILEALPDTKIPNKEKASFSFRPFPQHNDKNKDDDEALLLGSSDNNDSSSPFQLTLGTARGLLLLVAAVWGTNFACVKYLEGLCFHPPCHHPPSEFAFARFGIAALVSWPLLLNQPLAVILAGLECGLTITIGYITQAMALTTIESGKCAFICSLTVVFVPVVAALLYKKPIKPTTVVAAAVALTGVGVLEGLVDIRELLGLSQAVAESGDGMVMGVGMDAESTSSALSATAAAASSSSSIVNALSGPLDSLSQTLGVSKGDIIALGQPLGFGYTFLRIEHYQEQFKDVPNRVLTIAAAQCVSVGVLSFLWMLSDYHWTIPNFDYMMEPHRVATLLWTGIVTTVAAIFLEGIALQKASATDASIAFSSEPVWASLFGFLLLHEQLGFDAYAGGAIIMLACIIGAAADLKEQEDNRGLEP